MKKIVITALLTVFCNSVLASQDGPGSGNGGDAAVEAKTGKVSFLDLKRLPGTIPFDPKLQDAYKILIQAIDRHSGYKQATNLPGAFSVFKTSELVKDSVLRSLSDLKFYLVMNHQPLPDPGDSGLVVFPINFEGKVKRLALQNPQTGEVLVDGTLLEKMKDRDVAGLFEHESLIRLWYQAQGENTQLESTEKIADIVNATFANKNSRFNLTMTPSMLANKMREAGFTVVEGDYKGLTRKSIFCGTPPYKGYEYEEIEACLKSYPKKFTVFINVEKPLELELVKPPEKAKIEEIPEDFYYGYEWYTFSLKEPDGTPATMKLAFLGKNAQDYFKSLDSTSSKAHIAIESKHLTGYDGKYLYGDRAEIIRRISIFINNNVSKQNNIPNDSQANKTQGAQ